MEAQQTIDRLGSPRVQYFWMVFAFDQRIFHIEPQLYWLICRVGQSLDRNFPGLQDYEPGFVAPNSLNSQIPGVALLDLGHIQRGLPITLTSD